MLSCNLKTEEIKVCWSGKTCPVAATGPDPPTALRPLAPAMDRFHRNNKNGTHFSNQTIAGRAGPNSWQTCVWLADKAYGAESNKPCGALLVISCKHGLEQLTAR